MNSLDLILIFICVDTHISNVAIDEVLLWIKSICFIW